MPLRETYNLSPSTRIIVYYKHLSQPQGHGRASEYDTNMTRDDYREEFDVKARDDCFLFIYFSNKLTLLHNSSSNWDLTATVHSAFSTIVYICCMLVVGVAVTCRCYNSIL